MSRSRSSGVGAVGARDAQAAGSGGGGARGLLAAALFVTLWATGAPVAAVAMPYADPASFLAARFGLAAALLALGCAALGARAPERKVWIWLALVGLLNHALYLGGLFGSISLGLSAGLAALIAGLNPIFIAAIASACGWERIGWRGGLGLGLGLAGAALALWPKIAAEPAVGAKAETAVLAATLCFAGTLALAVGTLIQRRRLAETPLAGGALAQYVVASCTMGLFAAGLPLLGETPRFEPTPALLAALGWQVILLSLGAITLFYWMLRRGEASRVASLMFLTPGAAAVVAWALLGETLGPLELLGFAIATVGVALASFKRRSTPEAA